jgi:YD repeat-containing protein
MFKAMIICALGIVATPALAQQTRVYDANGRSIGTAAPQGQGSTRYYDSRGKSLGTSTTTGNTTTFYGPGGNVTGTTTNGSKR